MDLSERIDARALRALNGLGDKSCKHLIDRFGSAAKALAASPDELRRVAGGGRS